MKIEEMNEQIEIPEGVTATYENDIMTIKGEKGELTRTFSHPKVNIKVDKNNIELKSTNVRRKEKALFGTYVAHIKNMIHGAVSYTHLRAHET